MTRRGRIAERQAGRAERQTAERRIAEHLTAERPTDQPASTTGDIMLEHRGTADRALSTE